MLGIRGAEAVTDKWKIRLQLTKPVTWVPLIWGERFALLYLSAHGMLHSISEELTCTVAQVCCVAQQPVASLHGHLRMLASHYFAWS